MTELIKNAEAEKTKLLAEILKKSEEITTLKVKVKALDKAIKALQ